MMKRHPSSVTRRWVLGALASGVAGSVWAEAPLTSPRPIGRSEEFHKRAAPAAERLIDKAALGGKISYVVADARTGQVLEARNPVLALPPASVTKAITAMYALENLGADYRFRTRLVATGPVVNGRVHGDLVLVGAGDPTIDTDMLGDLAARLKDAGVREVAGRFRIYAGVLPSVPAIDPGQPDHVGYNPALSGLNLNFNRVHFEWKRASGGYDISMEARARRYRPRVAVARMQVVDRSVPVFTYANTGKFEDWTVARGALGKGGSRWLPVRHPALYTAEVFQTLARSHGISLRRGDAVAAAPTGQVIAEHSSEPLRDILRDMLKYSTNVTAEAVGMTTTRARGVAPQNLAGSAQMMGHWLGEAHGVRRAEFADHSGLGDGTRMSASDMVRALVAAGPRGPLQGLMKEMHLKDDKGRPIKGGPVRVRAKTGTLNFVSALAGYVTAADGTELVFAIFTADEPRRERIPRANRERPKGARGWAGRSRTLQQALIKRWVTLYGT